MSKWPIYHVMVCLDGRVKPYCIAETYLSADGPRQRFCDGWFGTEDEARARVHEIELNMKGDSAKVAGPVTKPYERKTCGSCAKFGIICDRARADNSPPNNCWTNVKPTGFW